MVRLIYVTLQKHFIPPGTRSSKTKDPFDEFVLCFQDWTGNFTDLLYWDTDGDLNNRTLKDVLHKISAAIARLARENVSPILDKPGRFYPPWWFGNMRVTPDSIITKNLPDEERKSVLMLHLCQMHEKLVQIHKKKTTYYCYVC
jgi:hypothetical protein